VHGPHDHELEHAAHPKDAFSGRIAVMTAIFATLGAMHGVHGRRDAERRAALQERGRDPQDRSVGPVELLPGEVEQAETRRARCGARDGADAERYRGEVERYKKEKVDIEKDARSSRRSRRTPRTQSEVSLHEHHRWAQATTLIQVSIALAAITLLTRSRGRCNTSRTQRPPAP
jgi:hypothetical protein